MGVYIKGMEMPKSCDECPCFSQYDACDVTGSWKWADEFNKSKERLPDCPLVPVPPHGRLLDENKISEMLEVQREDEYNKTHRPKATWSRVMDCFEDLLGIVDTSIPAEEDEP